MRRLAFSFAALLALLPSVSRAADCDPAKLQNQLQLSSVAVGDSQLETLPVSLNGQPARFLLDTGGVYTQISADMAEALGLPVNRTGDALVDVTGRKQAGLVMVREFQFGNQLRRDMPLPITPHLVISTGLVGLDVLSPFDAELDFATGDLKLWAPGACRNTALGAAVAAIPFRLTGGHITFTVMLDGKPLPAILDSGSTITTLRADLAQKDFALTLGDAATPDAGALQGVSGLQTYVHVFQSLSFGPIALAAPRLTIIPDRAADGAALGGPELILGMDVLRKLHLTIAFTENKLYLSE